MPECGYGHRSKRPTCPRSGEPGSHYRRPPDADWAAPVVTRWNGTRGSARTAPFARAEPAQNALTLHGRTWPVRATLDCRACRAMRGPSSATQTQPLDERAVTLDVDLGHVLDQPATAPHQQEQPPPRVVVMLVHLEVLGQVRDPLGQQRDLRLRGSGVGVVQAVLAQNLFFLLGCKRHEISPSIGPRSW